MFAHGHNGAAYQAVKLGTADEMTVDHYAGQAREIIETAFLEGQLSEYSATAGLWLTMMGLLMEKDGLIRYSFNSPLVMGYLNRLLQHER